MKISWNWLNQYLNTDLAPADIAEKLTGCGLEVESLDKFSPVKGGLEGVVVGEVLTCIPHPGADHLFLTTVNAGSGAPLHIVCGAPNVAAGQKVPVALIGTTLYFGDKEVRIKKSKIRGELSEGMICAEDELGLGSSHEGIMVLGNDAVPGTSLKEYLGIEEDHIFEIGLTPNRSDAASHIGVARDLAAVLNTSEQTIEKMTPTVRLATPDVSGFRPDHNKRRTEVIVEDPGACPRYSGLTLINVKVAESPQWLKNRLGSVGLRPINNIVDITNFVLFETGQPLHAFDADKINGNTVVVKKLPESTKFTTLDGVERKLSAEDLMICNTSEPMCIAGVFGGMNSGVTDSTTSIFLESACFDPRHVRKTSRYHGLQTDASFRFERGADCNITVYALKRAALLIREIAGGEISSDVVDVYPDPVKVHTTFLSWSDLDRLAGMKIEHPLVKEILVSTGFVIVSEDETGIGLEIPSFKTDVTRQADVIEEVLRIFGYNRIKFSPDIKSSISYTVKPDRDKIRNHVSDWLASNGFSEIMNNSLTRSVYHESESSFKQEDAVRIFNPISRDLDVMRQTLLFGGLETIAYNQNRKSSDLKLFEYGTVYSVHHARGKGTGNKGLDKYREEKHLALFLSGRKEVENWNTADKKTDFFELKGIVNGLLMKTGVNPAGFQTVPVSNDYLDEGLIYQLNDKKPVVMGSLSGSLLRKFDCRQQVFYADINWDDFMAFIPLKDKRISELARFPEVRRDLALLLDRSVTFEEISKIALETEKKLIKKVGLFDVYEGDKIGEGKKSYAISVILQDEDKTLTDSVIEKVMNSLVEAYRQKLNAQIR